MAKILFKEKKRTVLNRSVVTAINWSVIINIIFVVVSGFLIFNSFRSFQQTREKLDILERARKEVTELRLRNISLILDKEKIETDDFTETDIRNRLNYSKKNEIVFVIPDESLELAKLEVRRIVETEKAIADSKSPYEIWKELFLYGI